MRGKIGSLVLCALLVTSGCLEKSPPDMDGDGIHDSEDADMDGDGWENSVELSCTSDPNDGDDIPTDTDGDSVWMKTMMGIHGPMPQNKSVGRIPLTLIPLRRILMAIGHVTSWTRTPMGMACLTSGRSRGVSTRWIPRVSWPAMESRCFALGHMTTSPSRKPTTRTRP